MSAGDWTPIENGEFYCSPGCGNGRYCRRDHYDAAVRNADALAARMGPGWTPRVFENLGWFYDVSRSGGNVRVTVNEDRRKGSDPEKGYSVNSYTAWINVGDVSNSSIYLQFIETATDPVDAMGIATQRARTAVERIREQLAELLGDL